MSIWEDKIDPWLEKIEGKIMKKINDPELKQNIKRVGPCAYCGEWTTGSLAEGFVHKDDGEEACKDIDETAIPQQVLEEQIINEHRNGPSLYDNR